MPIANTTVTATDLATGVSVQFRPFLPTAEAEAQQQADLAAETLRRAIYAYECAGYGSHVTQPLREALASVEFSISEVRS